MLPTFKNAAIEETFRNGMAAGREGDHKAAVSWFQKGADMGNAECQYNFALKYYKREGLSYFDVYMTRKRLQAAANRGLKAAEEALNTLIPDYH